MCHILVLPAACTSSTHMRRHAPPFELQGLVSVLCTKGAILHENDLRLFVTDWSDCHDPLPAGNIAESASDGVVVLQDHQTQNTMLLLWTSAVQSA